MKEIWNKDRKLNGIINHQIVDPNKDYKWSQFVYTLVLNGEQYLFHTLTKQCWKTDASILIDGIVSGGDIQHDNCLNTLAEGAFLVPEEKDECAYYESVIKVLRLYSNKKGYKKYTILPTTACNARCTYCFEEGMRQISMSEEMTLEVIQFIKRTRRKNTIISLEWFGGEPLLGERQIDLICESLESDSIPYSGSIVTNGSLITDSIIDKMKNHWKIGHVQLSMEGPEEDYIRRKRYFHYQDYYRHNFDSVRKLAKNGIFVNIRFNVDEKNVKYISEFIHEMDREFPERKNVSAYFIPLNHVRAGENAWAIWQKCNEAKCSLATLGFPIKEDSFVSTLRVNCCIADDATGSVVIGPDGNLYKCECCEEGTAFGNVREGVTNQEILSQYTVYGKTREKCRTCVFLPECTSFSKCPIKDSACKSIRDEIQRRMMKQMISGQINPKESEPEKVC